ncbi:hypothetical protein [Burkholderia gladioli]|uniref:hypothetical protein n=1 Tax=Burkholderia gladioli TaxID=28095 RepID=UPI001641C6DE|nr:hypothetical protein [Burkholderia gladioli]MBJ9675230.1 hypothetical protein [Burkholderia gladioli]MDN7463482.1 hypothetical protein [Burkholderia gladioli]
MKTYEVAVAFPYAGRLRQVGEPIEVEERFVTVLLAFGRIREVTARRPTYRRRDMRPEG